MLKFGFNNRSKYAKNIRKLRTSGIGLYIYDILAERPAFTFGGLLCFNKSTFNVSYVNDRDVGNWNRKLKGNE